jgi:hypothetical protein
MTAIALHGDAKPRSPLLQTYGASVRTNPTRDTRDRMFCQGSPEVDRFLFAQF